MNSKIIYFESEENGERKKETGQLNPNWDELLKLLEVVQEIEGTRFVSFYSVLDSTGSVYDYSHIGLDFSYLGSLESENGVPIIYTLSSDTIPRIAVAYIPDTENAKEEFLNYIKPVLKPNMFYEENKSKTSGEEPVEINDCYIYQREVVPAGQTYISGSGYITIHPAIYEYYYVCSGGNTDTGSSGSGLIEDDDGGDDEMYRWPGSTGGRDAGCRPPLICDEEDENVPCEGNFIKNPRLAAQLGPSGMDGARFSEDARQYENGDPKPHTATDILSNFGDVIYSPIEGTAWIGHEADLGFYVVIHSTNINGVEVMLTFAHLQESGRPSNGSEISRTGLNIGQAGLSGNLQSAIDDGTAQPHTHIIAQELLNGTWTRVDPEKYITTKFDTESGTPIPFTDC